MFHRRSADMAEPYTVYIIKKSNTESHGNMYAYSSQHFSIIQHGDEIDSWSYSGGNSRNSCRSAGYLEVKDKHMGPMEVSYAMDGSRYVACFPTFCHPHPANAKVSDR